MTAHGCRYAGNGTWYTMPTNLYDLGSQLVAHMYALGQGGLGRNYSENTHWRFVMDNAVTQAVPEFKGLQSALSQSILDYRDLFVVVAALARLSCCTLIERACQVLGSSNCDGCGAIPQLVRTRVSTARPPNRPNVLTWYRLFCDGDSQPMCIPPCRAPRVCHQAWHPRCRSSHGAGAAQATPEGSKVFPAFCPPGECFCCFGP